MKISGLSNHAHAHSHEIAIGYAKSLECKRYVYTLIILSNEERGRKAAALNVSPEVVYYADEVNDGVEA